MIAPMIPQTGKASTVSPMTIVPGGVLSMRARNCGDGSLTSGKSVSAPAHTKIEAIKKPAAAPTSIVVNVSPSRPGETVRRGRRSTRACA